MTDIRVRFAPSPTGRLHVGNARVALINWALARQSEAGHVLLRMDDTDDARSTAAFAQGIEQDLTWLGLDWDRLVRQSSRLARYDAAFETLKALDRVYPCYETPEELELKRKSRLSRGLPPLYDRAALGLSAADRAALEASGRRPHWRFRVEAAPILWEDGVRGPVRFDGAHLSDPVLIRADGRPLYTLPSVVDDADFAITHVFRGEDHVANTAVQIQIFEALGAAVPTFGHFALLSDAAGGGLSKRLGSLSLEQLQEDGLEPLALLSLLARLGTSQPIEPFASREALLAGFSVHSFGRATAKFDPRELEALNARILHELPYEAVAPRLAALLDTDEKDARQGFDATFWQVIRPNLGRLDEAVDWHRICHGPVAPMGAETEQQEAAFLRTAAHLLPPEPWDNSSWKQWTDAAKAETGRKGKALFRPLRLALTGRDQGPEMRLLLPLIGRSQAFERLIKA